MRVLFVFLMTAAVLLAAGCEGEQGPTGPSGTDGNANVLTGTISPTNAEWLNGGAYSLQTTPGSWTSYFTRYVAIPVAEITPDIIANGAVLVSFEAHPGSGKWTPLPFQFVEHNAGYIITIVNEVIEGEVRLHYFNMLNSAGVTPPILADVMIPTYTFKYTVIEGNALQAMTASEVDVTDHDQVMEFLSQ